MNFLLGFSAFMAFFYVPWDFFLKPVSQDEEVWLGFVLTGWWAKASEPLHWALYAAGTYGFWRMRPWMWPWAAVYTAQIAVGMAVWNVRNIGGVWGWLGGLVVFAILTGLTYVLWRARELFRRSRVSLRERYGEWALVTGASAGIGAEFARALAREGLSCVLVARREHRLRRLATDLEEEFSVATRIVVADLARADETKQIADAVADLEIAVLVNNAGVGYAGRFSKQAVARLRDMIELNCTAALQLTHHFLAGMQERRRGAVIFVGSVAGHQPVPLRTLYSATKAFERFFGDALWAEMRGTGIDVLSVEPGTTQTAFQRSAGEVTHPGQPPTAVVRDALDALGQQPAVVSGWLNWLRSLGVRVLPRSVSALLAQQVVARWTPEEMR